MKHQKLLLFLFTVVILIGLTACKKATSTEYHFSEEEFKQIYELNYISGSRINYRNKINYDQIIKNIVVSKKTTSEEKKTIRSNGVTYHLTYCGNIYSGYQLYTIDNFKNSHIIYGECSIYYHLGEEDLKEQLDIDYTTVKNPLDRLNLTQEKLEYWIDFSKYQRFDVLYSSGSYHSFLFYNIAADYMCYVNNYITEYVRVNIDSSSYELEIEVSNYGSEFSTVDHHINSEQENALLRQKLADLYGVKTNKLTFEVSGNPAVKIFDGKTVILYELKVWLHSEPDSRKTAHLMVPIELLETIGPHEH